MNIETLTSEIKGCILEQVDSDAKLEIIDETYKHKKHKGFIDGRFHILVNIDSEKLKSLPRVRSHKLIYSSMDSLIKNHIHALSIKIKK